MAAAGGRSGGCVSKAKGKQKAQARHGKALAARRSARTKKQIAEFLATDEGKSLVAERRKTAVEEGARELAERFMTRAYQKAAERTLGQEVGRWAQESLESLMAQAAPMHAKALCMAAKGDPAARRLALEIEAVHDVVEGQVRGIEIRDKAVRAELEKDESERQPIDEEALRTLTETTRRGCVLALANVYARVTVADIEVEAWAPGMEEGHAGRDAEQDASEAPDHA